MMESTNAALKVVDKMTSLKRDISAKERIQFEAEITNTIKGKLRDVPLLEPRKGEGAAGKTLWEKPEVQIVPEGGLPSRGGDLNAMDLTPDVMRAREGTPFTQSEPLPPLKPSAPSPSGMDYLQKRLYDDPGEMYTLGPRKRIGEMMAAVGGGAKKAHDTLNQMRAEERLKFGKSLKWAKARLRKEVWDASGNVKAKMEGTPEGRQAVISKNLALGASAKADYIYGNVRGEIYGRMGKGSQDLFDNYIKARRIVTVEKYKPGRVYKNGTTAKDFQDMIDALPADVAADFQKRGDAYFKVMRDQLDQLHERGLIDDVSYQNLAEKGDYSPFKFLQHIDPERSYSFGGNKISVPDSGIKALKEGSMGALETDTALLLQEVISRTQGRIFKNEANIDLYKMARDAPDNGVVVALGDKTKTPSGMERISVVVDGQTKSMAMPFDMAKEWVIRGDPQIMKSFGVFLKYASGAPILRATATGMKPAFALTNFPRDVALISMSTKEYSSHLPITLMQMSRNLAKTFPDAFLKKGAYEKYINEGGGMSFLTHQGHVFRKPVRSIYSQPVRGAFQVVQKVLGAPGEFAEVWNRLALRDQALRNGKTPKEATMIARGYLDFGQGGRITKALDQGAPYLNAGVQATRSLTRAAYKDPALFAYKAAWLGTLSTLLYMANRENNKEALDQIPSYEKANNFIITRPEYKLDKDGNKRYQYIRIAKDQGQRIFSAIFEAGAAKYYGDEVDVEMVTRAAKEFLVLTPGKAMPPTLKAYFGYAMNKDFWRSEDIWKGRDEIRLEAEYTQYTNPALIKMGKQLGMSPERMRYALEQVFTGTNPLSEVVGYSTRLMFGELTEEQRAVAYERFINSVTGKGSIVRYTDPTRKDVAKLKEVKVEANTERKLRNDEFFKGVSEYEMTGGVDKLREFLTGLPEEQKKSYTSKLKTWVKLKGVPERRWWTELKTLDPETRAEAFWVRYQSSDPDKKEQLRATLRRAPGIATKRFTKRLGEIVAEQ